MARACPRFIACRPGSKAYRVATRLSAALLRLSTRRLVADIQAVTGVSRQTAKRAVAFARWFEHPEGV